MRITERVHMVSDAEETVNAAFIATEWGTVVIDTMRTPRDGELLKEHVNANTAKSVRLVINTHFHGDHTFGNAAFSVPKMATKRTRNLLRDRLLDRWRELAGPDVPIPLPDITFSGSADIHTSCCTLQLREVGGHAPGLLIVHIPEESLVCTSDLIFSGRLPFMADADLAAWIQVLRDLENQDIQHVVPGHGKPGTIDIVRKQRTWLEEFRERALDTLRETPDPDRAAVTLARALDAPEDRLDMLRVTLANLADSDDG